MHWISERKMPVFEHLWLNCQCTDFAMPKMAPYSISNHVQNRMVSKLTLRVKVCGDYTVNDLINHDILGYYFSSLFNTP